MHQLCLYRLIPLFLSLNFAGSKIHHLSVIADPRQYIQITNFAFLRGSYFNVEISNFTTSAVPLDLVGFTFSKGNAIEEILKNNPLVCPLNIKENNDDFNLDDIVYFFLDFPGKSLDIERRGDSVEKLEVCSPVDPQRELCSSDLANSATAARANEISSIAKTVADTNSSLGILTDSGIDLSNESDASLPSLKKPAPLKKKPKVTKREADSYLPKESKSAAESGNDESNSDDDGSSTARLIHSLPLIYENKEYYSKLLIRFRHTLEEGEYYFYFHNCYNYQRDYSDREPVSFSISIVEKNPSSYLPAGEIVKPKLYFWLAVSFLVTALVWVFILRSKRENVYKIHYLMAALVFIKALSLLFHGVNFYFISTRGRQQEAWAVVYYIMHLLKGALLFGTIILIGTGWTFFKNFLTDRDRRLFMVILPLQVLDNIALIIILETEEGERSYRFWWQLFILVDLLCCAAIILPVIWSIRHLQEASQTDGKAAFNLKKLKLFRHFYIIVIVYIYTTRILRYLISFVVPFQYEWLLVVVEEIGTWFFFAVTGYKFRPASNNPYLRLAQSDDESDTDIALTQSGALDGVVRVKTVPSGRSRKGKREDEEEQETGLLAEHSLEHD